MRKFSALKIKVDALSPGILLHRTKQLKMPPWNLYIKDVIVIVELRNKKCGKLRLWPDPNLAILL